MYVVVLSYLSPIVSASESLTSMPDPDIRPLSNSHTRSPARQIHLTLTPTNENHFKQRNSLCSTTVCH